MKESETVHKVDHSQPNHTAWPGAFSIYQQSKTAIMNNIWLIVGLTLTYIAVSVAFGIMLINPDNPYSATDTGNNMYNIISLVLGSIASIVSVQLVMRSIEGRKLDLADSFEKATFSMFVKMLLLSILTGLLLVVSLLALVVPFFFVLPRLVLAPYFLVEKNTGITEALDLSWKKTKGHSMKVWGVIGATIVMALPAVTVIGIPVAIYLLFMYAAAFGLLYLFINHKSPVATQHALEEPAYPKV